MADEMYVFFSGSRQVWASEVERWVPLTGELMILTLLPSLWQSKSLVRDSCFPSVVAGQRLTLFMLASCRTDYAEKMTSGSSSL